VYRAGRTRRSDAHATDVTSSRDGVQVSWPAEPGARYELLRAPCAPLAGAYEKLAPAVLTGGSFLDKAAEPGKVYAYLLTRPGGTVVAAGHEPALAPSDWSPR